MAENNNIPGSVTLAAQNPYRSGLATRCGSAWSYGGCGAQQASRSAEHPGSARCRGFRGGCASGRGCCRSRSCGGSCPCGCASGRGCCRSRSRGWPRCTEAAAGVGRLDAASTAGCQAASSGRGGAALGCTQQRWCCSRLPTACREVLGQLLAVDGHFDVGNRRCIRRVGPALAVARAPTGERRRSGGASSSCTAPRALPLLLYLYFQETLID